MEARQYLSNAATPWTLTTEVREKFFSNTTLLRSQQQWYYAQDYAKVHSLLSEFKSNYNICRSENKVQQYNVSLVGLTTRWEISAAVQQMRNGFVKNDTDHTHKLRAANDKKLTDETKIFALVL